MVTKYGIRTDKEIAEGWTIQDYIDEIDMLLWDIIMGYSFRKSPQSIPELKDCIRDLIPKHMFHNSREEDFVVKELTKMYARKWGYEIDY